MSAANRALDNDLQKILKTLRRLPKEYQRERKKMIRVASRPMVKAMRSRTPVGSGILRRAITVFSIRRSPDLFVGVKKKGRKSKYNVDGKSAFYAHFIEYGFRQIAWPQKRKKVDKYTPNRITYVEGKGMIGKGYAATKSIVSQRLIIGARKILTKYKRRYERN